MEHLGVGPTIFIQVAQKWTLFETSYQRYGRHSAMVFTRIHGEKYGFPATAWTLLGRGRWDSLNNSDDPLV
jgi:hypothetical protein